MSEFHTINEIIDQAFKLVHKHPLIRDPIVFNSVGTPIRITEYRNDDGFDGNDKGITLGIFPFTYGSSDLTVGTTNVAVSHETNELGDRMNAREARERSTLNLVVKLSMKGMSRKISEYGNGVKMTTNEYEEALEKWLPIVRIILRSKPLVNVGGFVNNSRVRYEAFKTVNWTGDSGKNAVLHSAALLWQLDYCSMLDIRALPYNRVEGITEGWTFIGVRCRDLMDIYWDNDRKEIMTLSGYPLKVTPLDIPVKWNPELKRFEHRLTGVALTAEQLKDPEAPEGRPWIDTDLRIVGIVLVPATETDPASRWNVYLKPSTGQLVKADGTTNPTLPDGSTLAWDGPAGRLRVTPVSDRSLEQLIDLTEPSRVLTNVNDLLELRRQERIYVP